MPAVVVTGSRTPRQAGAARRSRSAGGRSCPSEGGGRKGCDREDDGGHCCWGASGLLALLTLPATVWAKEKEQGQGQVGALLTGFQEVPAISTRTPVGSSGAAPGQQHPGVRARCPGPGGREPLGGPHPPGAAGANGGVVAFLCAAEAGVPGRGVRDGHRDDRGGRHPGAAGPGHRRGPAQRGRGGRARRCDLRQRPHQHLRERRDPRADRARQRKADGHKGDDDDAPAGVGLARRRGAAAGLPFVLALKPRKGHREPAGSLESPVGSGPTLPHTARAGPTPAARRAQPRRNRHPVPSSRCASPRSCWPCWGATWSSWTASGRCWSAPWRRRSGPRPAPRRCGWATRRRGWGRCWPSAARRPRGAAAARACSSSRRGRALDGRGHRTRRRPRLGGRAPSPGRHRRLGAAERARRGAREPGSPGGLPGDPGTRSISA